MNIICSICENKYSSIDCNPDSDIQGDKCASYVIHDVNLSKIILCCYGSDFDGNIYEFSNLNKINIGTIICDDCIRNMINTNNIRLVSSDNYFYGI